MSPTGFLLSSNEQSRLVDGHSPAGRLMPNHLRNLGTVVFGFVSDDTGQIVQNKAFQSWGATWNYFHQDVWMGLLHFLPYYRPILMFWLRLNYVLFGLQPYRWHISLVLLHTVASVLMCRLADRMLHNRAAACAAGVLFAPHPVHIESVACYGERSCLRRRTKAQDPPRSESHVSL